LEGDGHGVSYAARTITPSSHPSRGWRRYRPPAGVGQGNGPGRRGDGEPCGTGWV